MSLILGFDAGGTFTDSVVFNTETKKIISSGKALQLILTYLKA